MSKFCVIIYEESKDENGEYIPVVVTEGETGYRPLGGADDTAVPWTWGKDPEKAKDYADNYNEKLGITPLEADFLALQSMFPKAMKPGIPGFRRTLA
jgi:hypothetical protein